jgi:hypothetical protein
MPEDPDFPPGRRAVAGEITVDPRGRTSLAPVVRRPWARYAVRLHPDGTLVLIPAGDVTRAGDAAARGRHAARGPGLPLRLGRLRELADRRRDLDALIEAETVSLLADGASYGDIGDATGISRQAARQRHQRRRELIAG